jgi:23S rRNA (pseudouridine1915-N3)-methyltransferase
MLVTVGRVRDAALAAAIAEYEKRAARYWKLEVREIREERGSDAVVVRRREGERLLEQLGSAPYVACHEQGRTFSSPEFAAWLGESRDSARATVFVIGGAYGLDDEVRRRAAFNLALAPWTLPHELARLILVEQLYRAGTILRGEPYHK